MHFGATLRLLRLESGLGLRDLARRLGVSSAYLSRVEHGLDSAPTPERLRAMAGELGVPAALLIDLARRVSPFVADYIERVPEAGELFLEIAHRRLSARQVGALRALLDAEFPGRGEPRLPALRLSDWLSVERIVLWLDCPGIQDVLDVGAGRLAPQASDPAALALALKTRESELSSAIGGGVAVPCADLPGRPAAALVTLARPIACATPDGQPLRAVILLGGPRGSAERRRMLGQVARLAARGLASELEGAEDPAEALERLAGLEP